MRVVVTGGTGHIGHELVMSLANDGHQVMIVSRNPKQNGPMPETVSFHQYDAKTAEGWAHLVDGADAVVNLAGENLAGSGFLPTRWSPERKKLILNSRLNVGNAVVEAIKLAEKKPSVLIQASAVGYYGTHPFEKDITEDAPAGDDFLADVCVQWEASTQAVEEMGVRRAIIRTGIVLDKDDGTLLRLALPFKLFAGGPLGSGKQPMPWIHIDDEVGAVRFLIDHSDASGPFNLSAPGVVMNYELARALGRALNRPSFFPTPGIGFKLAFGELAVLLLEGQKALPARLQELGYAFKYTDVESALNAIYKPTDMVVAS